MKRMRKTGILAGAALAMLLGVGQAAEAAPIVGDITFGGTWSPTGAGGNIVGATGVDVVSDFAFVTCAAVSTCSGSYSALNGQVLGATYNDFQFNPFVASTPLWTFTYNLITYSFDLLSANVVTQNATTLALTGTGTLNITGFTPTTGSWSFSGDTTGGLFAFSATNTATGVPEPASVLLLGLGLLAGGRAVRRRLAK